MTKDELLDIYLNQTNTKLFSKEAIREYTGDIKRAYRLLLAHYFASSFVSNEAEFNWSQFNISRMHMARKSNHMSDLDKAFIKEVKTRSISYLCTELEFKFVNTFEKKLHESRINDSVLNTCVNFLLSYLSNNERTLFLYGEIKDFWNIDALYQKLDSRMRVFSNHWIELVPFRYHLPIHTFPEYFAYQDMINTWNDTIDKYTNLKGVEFSREKNVREMHYTYNSSLRTSLILGVHFFETYLYYLYYNLKSTGEFSGNRLINRNDVRKINDKQIVKDLLYKEFPNLESIITAHYRKYLETLEYRDAFVHMSAFSENGLSRMQYLLNVDIDIVSEALQNIADLVEMIETNIGNYEILFWKAKVEWPVFNDTQKNSVTII